MGDSDAAFLFIKKIDRRMRTIKFRGKAYCGLGWVYGDMRQRSGHNPSIFTKYDKNGKVTNRKVAVLKDTVGQFTGLHDKDGREIYEGDILRWRDKDYVVTFFNGMFYGSVEECNENVLGGYPLWMVLAQEDAPLAVVGNVTDNPELLKGGRKMDKADKDTQHPTFDEILEANRDVLERIKERGD